MGYSYKNNENLPEIEWKIDTVREILDKRRLKWKIMTKKCGIENQNKIEKLRIKIKVEEMLNANKSSKERQER